MLTGRVVVRVLLGSAALVGLFAMHGLAPHQALPQSGHDHAAMDLMEPARGVQAADPTMKDDSAPSRAALRPPAGLPDEDGHGLGLLGLCLAVLAVVLVTTMVLARSRSAHRLGIRELLTVVGPVAMRRDRDPPCLLVLSIQRC